MATLSVSSHACAPRKSGLGKLLSFFALARQRRQLANLDHHALEDMGLTRADVQFETSRPIWDVPAHWRG